MNVNLACKRVARQSVPGLNWYDMAENVGAWSTAGCDAVHLQGCTIWNRGAVPLLPSHFTAVDRHEYTGYVIVDLLQNSSNREFFIPRNVLSSGLYQYAPPQLHYNRYSKWFSQDE